MLKFLLDLLNNMKLRTNKTDKYAESWSLESIFSACNSPIYSISSFVLLLCIVTALFIYLVIYSYFIFRVFVVKTNCALMYLNHQMYFMEKKGHRGTSKAMTAEQSNHLCKWSNLNVLCIKKFKKLYISEVSLFIRT